MTLYYFDTCIWLDYFEDRVGNGFEKGKAVEKLIKHIIKNNDKILYTPLISDEMRVLNYTIFEIEELFKQFDKILVSVEPANKQLGKSKDLSAKRNIPFADAFHAIVARDNNAILITCDNHFRLLYDIIIARKPEEII